MTGKCSDDRFAKMLHRYELDLLSAAEREEFEMHLLECDCCFEQVQQFSKVARHLRHSPNVRRTVDEIVGSQPSDESPREAAVTPIPGRNWTRLVRNSLIAAAVLTLLILRPWRMEFYPTEEAVAAENRLAIMYFQNVSDPDDQQRWGQSVTSLLITDLSESQYVQVVSAQRLYDILKLLDAGDEKVIDRGTATRVAEEADARWMLTGDIITGPGQMALTAQLVDVSSGNVLASQRVDGDSTDNIFTLVDRLTVKIKSDLSLPGEALIESDPRVADQTTHSTEAYRHYLEGIDNYLKMYSVEARASFEKALEYDSTFAMAYYYLSLLVHTRENIDRAVRYADRTSHREQYFIRSRQMSFLYDYDGAIALLDTLIERYPDEKEAYFYRGAYRGALHEYDEALSDLNRAIEIDPLYKTAFNRLAYLHNTMGNFDQAIWAINRYISLVPEEPNPYDTRGDIYSVNGSLDKAIDSYLKALEMKPDFHASLRKLGNCYIFKGDYDRADSCFRELMLYDNASIQILGRIGQVFIALRQGHFNRALDLIDENLGWLQVVDTAQGVVRREYPAFNLLKVLVYEQQGRIAAALTEAESLVGYYRARQQPDSMSAVDHYARLLVADGRTDEADRMLQQMKAYIDRNDFGPCYYHWGSAPLEMARGNSAAAVEHLETAAGLTRPSVEFFANYRLGRAYLETGRISRAVEVLEEQLTYYSLGRLYYGCQNVKMHYYLGLAYEESRWYDRAIEQYETFLEIWSDADPGISEIEDARRRTRTLKARS